jgi:hypothetical protein
MATPTLAPRISPREPAGRPAEPHPATAMSTATRRGRQPRTGFVLYVALDHPGAASTSPTELLKIAETLGDRAREWLPRARTYSVLSIGENAPRTVPGSSTQSFSELLAALPVAPRVHIDVPGRQVTVDGVVCRITRQEFDLLAHLVRADGAPVSRGRDVPAGSRTVDVHVRRIREKTGLDSLVNTVRGAGYRVSPQTGMVVTW